MPVEFGLAVENFTPASRRPSGERILAYAGAAEALGYQSLWAWDHLFLGTRRPFPFLEALSTLAALSTRTSTVTLGTGVLVLPLRNPVVLAKDGGDRGPRCRQGGSSSAWPRAGTSASSRPRRPLPGAWPALRAQPRDPRSAVGASAEVSGDWDELDLRGVVMLPLPASRPRPQLLIGGYVDRVLRRVATMRRRLADVLLHARRASARRGRGSAATPRRPGRDPDSLTQRRPAADLRRRPRSRTPTARVRAFVAEYFDVAEWSESTPDSAIRGTPEQCAEQLAEHVAAGVQHIVLVPCDYALDQVERIAAEVLPALRPRRSVRGTPRVHGRLIEPA